MSFQFGESWDCYAAVADAVPTYWDSGAAGTASLGAGRFSGSQCLSIAGAATSLVKNSGANDAVHHLCLAFRQSPAITGTTLGAYLLLSDGATGQCAIVFRSDGAILLTSGTAAGATLATYPGAFPVANTWYQFEIEVVVHNSTGSFKVRKNGNPVDDHSTTGIDTAGGTANNYANKLTVSMQGVVNSQGIDDLYWRSDASSVPWAGDMKCITRYPASDASVQFSRAPTNYQQINQWRTRITYHAYS